MSKYVAKKDDIPSGYNLGKSQASKMLATIHESRKDEDGYELTTTDDEEELATPNTELEDDFKIARENISKLLKISSDAIESFYETATSTDSPLAIEILSGMIKDSIDMNKNLIDIHQQRERIVASKINNGSPVSGGSPTQNNITTQNNIMCSPADLLKMIHDTNSAIDATSELLPLPPKDTE